MQKKCKKRHFIFFDLIIEIYKLNIFKKNLIKDNISWSN